MKKEVRQKVLIRDFYTCQVCGDTPGPQYLQIAHRMANTVEALDMLEKIFPERSRKWLQDNVLDHPHNLVATCSLSCNASCNILKKPVNCAVLINEIMSDINCDNNSDETIGRVMSEFSRSDKL